MLSPLLRRPLHINRKFKNLGSWTCGLCMCHMSIIMHYYEIPFTYKRCRSNTAEKICLWFPWSEIAIHIGQWLIALCVVANCPLANCHGLMVLWLTKHWKLKTTPYNNIDMEHRIEILRVITTPRHIPHTYEANNNPILSQQCCDSGNIERDVSSWQITLLGFNVVGVKADKNINLDCCDTN